MASPYGHCPICLTELKSKSIMNVMERTQKGTDHTCTPFPDLQCSCPSSCPGEEWGRIRWGWGVSLGNILARPMETEEMASCFWFLSSWHFLWIYGTVVCCFCVLSPHGLLFHLSVVHYYHCSVCSVVVLFWYCERHIALFFYVLLLIIFMENHWLGLKLSNPIHSQGNWSNLSFDSICVRWIWRTL